MATITVSKNTKQQIQYGTGMYLFLSRLSATSLKLPFYELLEVDVFTEEDGLVTPLPLLVVDVFVVGMQLFPVSLGKYPFGHSITQLFPPTPI